MPNTILVVMVIIGLLFIGGLVYFLHRRRLSKSGKKQLQNQQRPTLLENVSPSATIEDQAWLSLNINPQAIKALEAQTRKKMLPNRLTTITHSLNQNLIREGFDFQMSHAQVLDILITQSNLAKVGRNVNILESAIWVWIDYSLRKESREDKNIETILAGEEISPECLKKRFNILIAEAKVKKKSNSVIDLGRINPITKNTPKGAPLTANSIEKLIRQEAEFHTRKLLGLKPKDPIPDNKKDILLEQMELAYKRCKEKGYNVSTIKLEKKSKS